MEAEDIQSQLTAEKPGNIVHSEMTEEQIIDALHHARNHAVFQEADTDDQIAIERDTKHVLEKIKYVQDKYPGKSNEDIPFEAEKPVPLQNEVLTQDVDTYRRIFKLAMQIEGVTSQEALDIVEQRIQEENDHAELTKKSGLDCFFGLAYYVTPIKDDPDKLRVLIRPAITVCGKTNLKEFLEIADVPNNSFADKLLLQLRK